MPAKAGASPVMPTKAGASPVMPTKVGIHDFANAVAESHEWWAFAPHAGACIAVAYPTLVSADEP